MINYTCAKCNIELKCIKNDIPLIHFLDNDKVKGIDALRFGDLWGCPVCKCRVILGMGNQILGMDINQKEILKRDYVEVKRSE